MTLRHLLPRTMNKDLSTKTTKYILKCWERSVKRKLNLNFIRVIKIYLLINVFYMYMVRQNLSKNSLMTISCSPLRTSLVTSATLLLRHKIFWLCQFSTEYTISNCRRITFVTINTFFLLSKPHPLFLTDNIKMDGIPTKNKWKMHTLFALYFKFWRYFL